MITDKDRLEELSIESEEGERDDICAECGKPWNSEYHASDQCVKGGDY